MAAGGRVSIPAVVRRTIADIKEIAGGHNDEEVYAMLRECNMDPNETAQKLLLQDTFHEVKRKRNKKKEGNKEPSDSRWRPVMQGLGVKSGRGNYSSRHLANTTGPWLMLRMFTLLMVHLALLFIKDRRSRRVIGSGHRRRCSPSLYVLDTLHLSSTIVPNKEWKPKQTSTTAAQATENDINPDDIPLTAETVPKSTPISNSISKEDLLKVDKRFDDLQLSDRQHVIIPDHLQISESEKYGLTFGSFNTSFQQTIGSSNPECVKSSSTPEYESSQELDDIGDGSMSRDQNSSCIVHEATDPDPQAPPAGKLENHSPSEVENSSITPEITDSNVCRDASDTSRVPQSSIVQTTPPYSTFGLPPQLHGNQTSSLETSESQVQQSIDFSTSESYRPTADSDGRLSPFLSPVAVIKYGNIPVLSAQTSQNQEGSNSSVVASSGSAPLATPSAGVVPTSNAVPQQSVPVFRPPVGVHLPHYPPNYIPYNQYISPFFVPPATLHPFLGDAAFPQPPSTGAMYPAPGSAAVGPPVKYSTPSFKPGANTGSQASVGIPGAYGAYCGSPSVYTNNTTVANGNPAENDDVASSQFKENSIYIAGQQSEGSTIWIPALGREISGLQANSFYGLPPQGQHITFAPGQSGHGPFGGIYHPAQTVAGAAIHPLLQPSQTMAGAVELVGPAGSVYQQPQTQINWGNY